ncbi:MAG TPA: hypothetical protein PK280_01210 [Planctomycetota bacterium]|nr:hypothetical protein [Planctomycetota bacterium]
MSGKKRAAIIVLGLVVLAGAGLAVFALKYEVRTVTDYRDPELPADEVFTDDPVPAARPAFDPALVDSRRLNGWEVNSSAAVLRLDCPPFRPKQDKTLEILYPSYAVAARAGGQDVLPSVNMIDGKAKQFDDGLYAAVDLAAYKGIEKRLAGCRDLVKRLAARAPAGSEAAALLGAAQALAAGETKTGSPAGDAALKDFLDSQVASKPIGFYTWSKELEALWRVERFLAQERKPGVAGELGAALKSDPQLLADYRKFVGLFRKLTNPLACLTLDELPDGKLTAEVIAAEAKKRGIRRAAVCFLPPSTCRESELAERLELPATGSLMREFMKRIKSGEIDLKPGQNAGWYDYQVYALETLLVPQKGEERDKLVLSARYKQRMQEAFSAILTKRRETHARQLPAVTKGAPPRPPTRVQPRLRLEPAPSYYLRTARAYAFVETLLKAELGEEALKELYGLRFRELGGTVGKKNLSERDDSLAVELASMRALYHGLYLVSCEDLGLAPALLDGEVADQAAARLGAENWLANCARDPDLAADTRVAVPVICYGMSTELWATLGVRLTRFKAEYAFGPSIRQPGGEWQECHETRPAEYLIPVDTFVSFTVRGNRVLDRKELREMIEKAGTRDKFLEMVGKQ